jgi:hypothetical protein
MMPPKMPPQYAQDLNTAHRFVNRLRPTKALQE